jgi:hypothetical protein
MRVAVNSFRQPGEKMIKTFARIAAMALTLGVSQAATAVTVFNNGGPDLVSGTGMTEFLVADNFSVGSGGFDITNLRFFSAQDAASAYVGSISWAVYSDATSLPGSVLNSGLATVAGTATGGSTGFGYGIYSFDIPVSFTLAAGNYWLALHNGPLSNTTSAGDMTWATTATGIGPASVYKDGTWISSGNELAFRVDGTATVVPEPEGIALFLAGLAVCGVLRAKRRQ